MKNLFASIPDTIDEEIFEDLLKNDTIRIERILSRGQTSPEHFWYDQNENEWVLILKGSAVIAFDDGSQTVLKKGDHLNIPAHKKHRVSWTDPDAVTVWLAVFY